MGSWAKYPLLTGLLLLILLFPGLVNTAFGVPNLNLQVTTASTTITQGQSFKITIQANNDGTSSTWQSIHLGFPYPTSSIKITKYESVKIDCGPCPNNTPVYGNYGKPGYKTQYPIVEASLTPSYKEILLMEIEVTPKSPGTFLFFAKTVAQDSSGKFYYFPNSGNKDNLDEFVESHYIDVKPTVTSLSMYPPWTYNPDGPKLETVAHAATARSWCTSNEFSGEMTEYSQTFSGGGIAFCTILHGDRYTAPVSGKYKINYRYLVDAETDYWSSGSLGSVLSPIPLPGETIMGTLGDSLQEIAAQTAAENFYESFLGVKDESGIKAIHYFVVSDGTKVIHYNEEKIIEESHGGNIPKFFTSEKLAVPEINRSIEFDLQEGKTYYFLAGLSGWAVTHGGPNAEVIRLKGQLLEVTFVPPNSKSVAKESVESFLTFKVNPPQAGSIHFLGKSYFNGNVLKFSDAAIMLGDYSISAKSSDLLYRFNVWTPLKDVNISPELKKNKETKLKVSGSGSVIASFDSLIRFDTEPDSIGEIVYKKNSNRMFRDGDSTWESCISPLYFCSLTLSAIPPQGYKFVKWKSDNNNLLVGDFQVDEINIELAGPVTVTAVFEPILLNESGKIAPSSSTTPTTSGSTTPTTSGITVGNVLTIPASNKSIYLDGKIESAEWVDAKQISTDSPNQKGLFAVYYKYNFEKKMLYLGLTSPDNTRQALDFFHISIDSNNNGWNNGPDDYGLAVFRETQKEKDSVCNKGGKLIECSEFFSRYNWVRFSDNQKFSLELEFYITDPTQTLGINFRESDQACPNCPLNNSYIGDQELKEMIKFDFPSNTEKILEVEKNLEEKKPRNKVPEWVRNIFIWYAENRISEDELLGAIEFLVDNGILHLRK